MSKLRYLTPETINSLYWDQGKRLIDIAGIYNVSIPAIRQRMKKFGISRRSNEEAHRFQKIKISDSELVNLYVDKKLSQNDIAVILEVSQTGIGKRLSRLGIKCRGKANIGSKNGMYGKTHSDEARDKIREATYKQFKNPENREKHAEITCRQIEEGRTGKAYNKIETLVAHWFDINGIRYKQQFRLGRFLFDFRIIEAKILVEVNGTFWHADPRVYNGKPLSAIQKRNLANDKRKAERAKQDGYSVVVLWEMDILKYLPAID